MRFCSLPTGEICIYGIQEIPEMTQITSQELAKVVCPPSRPSSAAWVSVQTFEAAILGAVLVAGVVVGAFRRGRMTR